MRNPRTRQISVGPFAAQLLASALILHGLSIPPVHAQEAKPASLQSASDEAFNTEQLDALLASVALYPDQLLTQLLMASTFPLQVVQAARWVQEPAHKDLKGDALAKALEAEP
jgi:hypothetical protein